MRNKKGEIAFRKKLADQLTNGNTSLSYQPTKEEYEKLLTGRVDVSRKIFQRLKENGISLSKFLEIGAERGQRSLLLTNEFGATGFMSDLSFESLNASKEISLFFAYNKKPIAICADAYNLPFRSNSIPFIFCFQTLHHFPDPYPIFKEIKRVLAPGGYFYFNEEPVEQRLNLDLFRRDYHLRWYEKILKKLIILHFISKIGGNEADHHIIETSFPLATWQRSIDMFDQADITLTVFPFGPTLKRIKNKKQGWINPPFFTRLLFAALGGNIEGLCCISNNQRTGIKNNISDFFACPNCKTKPKLSYHPTKKRLSCTECTTTFEKKNGIFMLLSEKQKKALYN